MDDDSPELRSVPVCLFIQYDLFPKALARARLGILFIPCATTTISPAWTVGVDGCAVIDEIGFAVRPKYVAPSPRAASFVLLPPTGAYPLLLQHLPCDHQYYIGSAQNMILYMECD
jgi:hypothetical protein